MNNSTVFFKKYLKYKNKYIELRGGTRNQEQILQLLVENNNVEDFKKVNITIEELNRNDINVELLLEKNISIQKFLVY